MTRFSHVVAIVATRGTGEDRAVVLDTADGILIALADGAGGTGNGAIAAQAVIDALTAERSPASLLEELDRAPERLGHGQTTAVVLSISERGVGGASVGDSGAWIIRDSAIEDLTDGQARKPLVGAGCAPFAIRAGPIAGGTLLVASDGLFRYAKPSEIARTVAGADLAEVWRELIALVRLPTGGLQDDVAIVLCRQI